MSERIRESLSALMDDEANELELERLLANVESDEQLRATWSRYHLARGAMAATPQALAGADISERVRAALDGGDQATAEVSTRSALWRPLASFGVAASVAAIVVLGGQQLATVNGPGDSEEAVVAGFVPSGVNSGKFHRAMQASWNDSGRPVLQQAYPVSYQEMARQRMGRYIQEHAEHAALNSPQGLVPFSKVPEIRD